MHGLLENTSARGLYVITLLMYMVHGANFYYSFSFHPSRSELTANVSNQDLPNGVPSVPVPNGSTSAYVSNRKFLSGVPSVSLPNCDPAGIIIFALLDIFFLFL
ncbi:uncharacterized protein A4U43_C04F1580 [Asparagus officinalis]|uniref:Uncharacterized protein n=1 Tax=Asparagus officinalis TaxID=4686 RepID=A0A5P1EXY9_ASPOF|nr:uncharacterized protein A4U43_C04F1580 [Asparagus officinalis]